MAGPIDRPTLRHVYARQMSGEQDMSLGELPPALLYLRA